MELPPHEAIETLLASQFNAPDIVPLVRPGRSSPQAADKWNALDERLHSFKN